MNTGKSFAILSDEDRKFMMIRELFIYKQLRDSRKFNQDVLKDKFPDVTQTKIDEEFEEEKLRKEKFSSNTNIWCKYCSNRELCVDYYAHLE